MLGPRADKDEKKDAPIHMELKIDRPVSIDMGTERKGNVVISYMRA